MVDGWWMVEMDDRRWMVGDGGRCGWWRWMMDDGWWVMVVDVDS
jgi:hypothetical protein